MSGALFVANQDVTKRRIIRKRIVERHDGAAGITPNDFYLFLEQDAADDLGAGQSLGHLVPREYSPCCSYGCDTDEKAPLLWEGRLVKLRDTAVLPGPTP